MHVLQAVLVLQVALELQADHVLPLNPLVPLVPLVLVLHLLQLLLGLLLQVLDTLLLLVAVGPMLQVDHMPLAVVVLCREHLEEHQEERLDMPPSERLDMPPLEPL